MAGVNRFDAFYLTDAGQARAALRTYAQSFRLHPATALNDWKHILLVVFTLIGFRKVYQLYQRVRSLRIKGVN